MLSWILPLIVIIGSLVDAFLVLVYMKIAHPWKDILFCKMKETEETQSIDSKQSRIQVSANSYRPSDLSLVKRVSKQYNFEGFPMFSRRFRKYSFHLQNQNDDGEDDQPVDTLYIGSNDIKDAVEKLKAELSLAQLDTNQKINDGKGTEGTIETNQRETSVHQNKITVLENQENEMSMDC